jgi:hypothetical protein
VTPGRGSIEPVSTYRIQLQPAFDFAALGEQTDYLAELGVSHAYLSPILQRTRGSTQRQPTSSTTAGSRGTSAVTRLRGAAGNGSVQQDWRGG